VIALSAVLRGRTTDPCGQRYPSGLLRTGGARVAALC